MNAIYCVVSWPGVPSVPPCRDGHHDGCNDPECRGCRARTADRGFLCQHHFHKLEQAYIRWGEFLTRWRALEGERAVTRDNAGVRVQMDGHANFTPGFMSVHEAEVHLRDAGGHRSLELWVHTEAGAAHAVQFAAAAERAFRDVETVERPHKIRRVRCPNCAHLLVWNPPAGFEGEVTVRCTDCGHEMDQDTFEGLSAS